MCPEAKTLSAYFDGELAESARAGVESHLKGCPACRAALDIFNAQRAFLLADSSDISGRDDRIQRFWRYAGTARLNRLPAPRRISVPLPLAVAAMLVLAVATVFNFVRFDGNSRPGIIVLDSRPQAPTMVTFTITPGELDNFFEVLEGGVQGDEIIHELPAGVPVSRFGDPMIIRSASEGAP